MKRVMDRNVPILGLTLLIFLGSVSSASNNAPAKIVNGLVSNAVSMAMKSIWSLKASTKTATTARPLMKFESGYNVETVFDGSKLGIEPHSIEVLPNGELLLLDSANCNLYRISSSLSLYSRPRLVAGSAEGFAGHVDGKLREARMNHPKGIAVDDRGNIYIADTMNMAIRKLSDAGMTTIAGGKWGRGGGHVDGPSEDAKFSDDFDVVYIGSSCSLLVIDRGNKAIREIQLHFDDCAYQYGTGFPLGIAMLLGAGFFGYMLALLQRRVGTIVSSQNEQMEPEEKISQGYQKPALKSFRPALIPTGDEPEKQEEGFFGSLAGLLANAGSSASDILGGVFPFLRRASPPEHHVHQKQHYSWPAQESFVIPDSDEPPPPAMEARTPTPRKTYPFMSMDAEKIHQLRQSRIFYSNNGSEDQNQSQNQHLRKYESPGPARAATCYFEPGREIVFGAVQEEERPRARRIEPIDYSDPVFDHHNIRYRFYQSNEHNSHGT